MVCSVDGPLKNRGCYAMIFGEFYRRRKNWLQTDRQILLQRCEETSKQCQSGKSLFTTAESIMCCINRSDTFIICSIINCRSQNIYIQYRNVQYFHFNLETYSTIFSSLVPRFHLVSVLQRCLIMLIICSLSFVHYHLFIARLIIVPFQQKYIVIFFE